MTRKDFNEGFAKELRDDEQENLLFHLENRLLADKTITAETPGWKLGVGALTNPFLEEKP